MTVRLTAEAERDLESIADHIARDSPERAVDFIQALRAKCLQLTDFPGASRWFPATRTAASGGESTAII
jgi:plasmid stabilization system protein ParE